MRRGLEAHVQDHDRDVKIIASDEPLQGINTVTRRIGGMAGEPTLSVMVLGRYQASRKAISRSLVNSQRNQHDELSQFHTLGPINCRLVNQVKAIQIGIASSKMVLPTVNFGPPNLFDGSYAFVERASPSRSQSPDPFC